MGTLGKQEQRWAALSTLLMSAIMITPLCGFLFQCGCDWPWAGLDSHCNFYQPEAHYHCPWCASLAVGLLSAGVATFAGVWAAIQSWQLVNYQQLIATVCLRTLLGSLVFAVTALLLAMLAALAQAYPLGVGQFIKGF